MVMGRGLKPAITEVFLRVTILASLDEAHEPAENVPIYIDSVPTWPCGRRGEVFEATRQSQRNMRDGFSYYAGQYTQ